MHVDVTIPLWAFLLAFSIISILAAGFWPKRNDAFGVGTMVCVALALVINLVMWIVYAIFFK